MYTKETYLEFLTHLKSKEDLAYKQFHQGLFKEELPLIGIRTPELKRIAKEISTEDYLSFFKYNTHTYYEEKVLHGLVLGYVKISFDEVITLIQKFLPYNDNWAINDLTCANLKIFKKNLDKGFPFIEEWLKSDNPWTIRFALILLLDHYVNDAYIDTILEICDAIKNENYYVKMGNAWLISLCYIKYRDKTLSYLKRAKIDVWTFNKSISKICDSYRVSKEDKEMLKKMKRK